jgi:phosphoribosylglycinamide formyltransferase 1
MEKNIVILISGRGSNMQAIVKACAEQHWNAKVAAVISNVPRAKGLEFAHSQGIQTEVIDHTLYPSREAFDAALANLINLYDPMVIVLAGFMRILTPAFVQQYQGRLVNIHPSLLPAYPGLNTHSRALADGCKVAGATVHFVTAELDHGPIIAQGIVPILPQDTADLLAQRILKVEHQMYPAAVRWLAHAELVVCKGIVTHGSGNTQLFTALT